MSFQERYEAAMHRIQTAISFRFGLEYPWMDQRLMTALKHIRVGLDGAKADQGALAAVLIRKGVITEQEYRDGILEFAEREAESQQEQLQNTMRAGGNPDLHIHTV